MRVTARIPSALSPVNRAGPPAGRDCLDQVAASLVGAAAVGGNRCPKRQRNEQREVAAELHRPLDGFAGARSRARQVAAPDLDQNEVKVDEDQFGFLAKSQTPLRHCGHCVARRIKLTRPCAQQRRLHACAKRHRNA